MLHIAILGLGQIGGSVGRAAVEAGHSVRAWTPSGIEPGIAVADGIGAARSVGEAVTSADLVVLAAPPLACLELLDLLADLGPDPRIVITDVASTKATIVTRARELGLRFVGGHPMAGREATGYASSDPRLFRDRPWVIVPPEPPNEDEAAMARVVELVAACGGRPLTMTAEEHDRAVGLISHLPLLVSAALVETAARSADWPAAAALAAGGWAGMTRLARGDVRMGSGIFATNHAEVAAHLATLRRILDEWEADLGVDDTVGLTAERLERARASLAEADV